MNVFVLYLGDMSSRLETYVFSHEQFLIRSISKFRRQWKLIFAVLTVILYATLGTFYVILAVKPEEIVFQNVAVDHINLCIVIANFAAPVGALLIRLYFGVWVLSGFSFASALVAEANHT